MASYRSVWLLSVLECKSGRSPPISDENQHFQPLWTHLHRCSPIIVQNGVWHGRYPRKCSNLALQLLHEYANPHCVELGARTEGEVIAEWPRGRSSHNKLKSHKLLVRAVHIQRWTVRPDAEIMRLMQALKMTSIQYVKLLWMVLRCHRMCNEHVLKRTFIDGLQGFIWQRIRSFVVPTNRQSYQTWSDTRPLLQTSRTIRDEVRELVK